MGAEVLGEVLGGGAAVDEGVDDGGEDAHGVPVGLAGLEVVGGGRVAGQIFHNFCSGGKVGKNRRLAKRGILVLEILLLL